MSDVVSGPEAADPVGASGPFWGVMQLGCGHHERRSEGQVGGPLRDSDTVVGGYEADPVELAADLGCDVGPAADLGCDVGPGERRPPRRDRLGGEMGRRQPVSRRLGRRL